jgi:LacI family transcriptional regulator
MPSIRQIAKACGVSPMTVSFVLNDTPGQVSNETRDRVLKTVREMGYRPTATPPARNPREICTLGLAAGVKGDSLLKPGYYTSIAMMILKTADALRHNVTFFTHSLFHSDPHKSIRVYCDGRCDGLIVIAPHVGSPVATALHERGVPLVIIGRSDFESSESFIDVDNIPSTRKIVSLAIEYGHRRIAMISGANFVFSTRQRMEAFKLTMEEHGIPIDPELVIDHHHTAEHVAEATRRLMTLPGDRRPTAIFCWNDTCAIQCMEELTRMGLRVPNDVSIIGFDDDYIATATVPALTTIRQPFDMIGRLGTELLLEMIRTPHQPPRQIIVAGEVVVRNSLARIKKG